ncbi:hypothetical protein ASPZODRAFT_67218 [Penicilliopsis zonata CBS 506.65]|uniref:Uncharacterized protein n=1 Tax=Penicilliopsis zonata CBS 506.65 TaxID=1073090 RepID=A0A1L9SGK6_9EURO|nr:hypothetical protein ASPZODRAFT_67218 [Penicilliopsis zonata CBS 506.65]OJJ46301.1 hypothetical protein ASPZODRAFT_67218 [Penicilliopsis zonata CBS 506.65]
MSYLSPLSASRQNRRDFSSPCFTGRKSVQGAEESENQNQTENIFTSPSKQFMNHAENDHQPPQYENDGQVFQDEEESVYEAPSSPFQFDGRDDTVDLQNKMNYRRKSLAVPGLDTSRKRSYDSIPEEEEPEEGLDAGRFKRSMSRHEEESEEANVIHTAAEVQLDVEPDTQIEDDNAQRIEVQEGLLANSMVEEQHNEGMSTVLHGDAGETKDNGDSNCGNDAMLDIDPREVCETSMDDTCLSTFSAVPNVDMTLFANLRGGHDSPAKSVRERPISPVEDITSMTPQTAGRQSRSRELFESNTPLGSPTPRKRPIRDSSVQRESLNLLDLTGDMSFTPRPRYSMQSNRYSPRRTPMRPVLDPNRSPSKLSLLDFDIPPVPTPRSIPSVTPRELESLKSGFLSEISSLKATLSGKEAEVASLKQAVADAERRVGEALEEVRNEAARKETLEMEQAEWERRGQEMETVLRNVKAEIESNEQERDRLAIRADEADKAREELEGRVVELESQLAAARKSAATASSSSSSTSASESTTESSKSAEDTAAEIQEAVEKVARELHTLYKGKHETKVAALKKSYEARWEKRVREAEKKWKEAAAEIDRLKADLEVAQQSSSTNKTDNNDTSMMMAHLHEEHETEKHVLQAQIKGLEQEMIALKNDSEQLRSELKIERAEKGELVAAVDEWLAMQQPQQPQLQQQQQQQQQRGSESPHPTAEDARTSPGPEAVRGYARGIRPPSTSSTSSVGSGNGTGSGPTEKKLSRFGAPAGGHSRGNSGGRSGIAVFTPGRSGIMGSIERMGRGNGN